jgi:hypothetical protein
LNAKKLPEPATLPLVCLGIGAWLAGRRRTVICRYRNG